MLGAFSLPLLGPITGLLSHEPVGQSLLEALFCVSQGLVMPLLPSVFSLVLLVLVHLRVVDEDVLGVDD